MILEDDVVLAVRDWLEAEGWRIVRYSLAHQRGDDLVAERNGMRLIVEAKGASSSREHTQRYGKPFNRGQIDSHIGRALTRLLARWADDGTRVAIALPDDVGHRARVTQIGPALVALRIPVFWVDEPGAVVVDRIEVLDGPPG